MSEIITETPQPLVTGRKADGRRHYEPEAKRKLIEAALQPGVSVARLALEHGLNANMLRTWITRYNRERAAAAVNSPAASMPSTSAFVPVIPVRPKSFQSSSRLRARLPNGVEIDLSDASGDAVASLLQTLSALSCSNSTKA